MLCLCLWDHESIIYLVLAYSFKIHCKLWMGFPVYNRLEKDNSKRHWLKKICCSIASHEHRQGSSFIIHYARLDTEVISHAMQWHVCLWHGHVSDLGFWSTCHVYCETNLFMLHGEAMISEYHNVIWTWWWLENGVSVSDINRDDPGIIE